MRMICLQADTNNGFIYDFDLNQNRTQIAPSTHNDTNTQFTDKIANNIEESKDAVFASGFPGITDLEVGLDGHLYVLSFHKSLGRIHKIVPRYWDNNITRVATIKDSYY